jgi:serine/threonine protein phosphatase 1
MMTILIGDIHGCYNELMEILDVVAPTADDRIIALGDIVDRGPDSAKVLEFFRDTPNAVSLMGNHERKHLLSARGQVPPALSQQITRAQLGDRYEEWLAYLETLPRHIELPEAILVHGMFEPGVALENQRDVVVIGTLTGEHYMTRNYPGPWYDHYDGPKPLVVGHHHYQRNGEPLIRDGLVYAIDTGCATGGRLTALILPEFRIVSVPSHGDHWARIQLEYAVMQASGRSDLDLDWETLGTYAESACAAGLPDHVAARARQCAAIAVECERLAREVCAGVKELSSKIREELSLADDWESCGRQKRISRYGQRVQGHSLAPLLFPARKGTLSLKDVYRLAKTPRGLRAIAEQLSLEAGFKDE